jgi:hypothetical protein
MTLVDLIKGLLPGDCGMMRDRSMTGVEEVQRTESKLIAPH